MLFLSRFLRKFVDVDKLHRRTCRDYNCNRLSIPAQAFENDGFNFLLHLQHAESFDFFGFGSFRYDCNFTVSNRNRTVNFLNFALKYVRPALGVRGGVDSLRETGSTKK